MEVPPIRRNADGRDISIFLAAKFVLPPRGVAAAQVPLAQIEFKHLLHPLVQIGIDET